MKICKTCQTAEQSYGSLLTPGQTTSSRCYHDSTRHRLKRIEWQGVARGLCRMSTETPQCSSYFTLGTPKLTFVRSVGYTYEISSAPGQTTISRFCYNTALVDESYVSSDVFLEELKEQGHHALPVRQVHNYWASPKELPKSAGLSRKMRRPPILRGSRAVRHAYKPRASTRIQNNTFGPTGRAVLRCLANLT